MGRCCVCGNEYADAFTVTVSSGENYVFDSLECAIDKIAPRCGDCGCRVVGHGVEIDGDVFCSAHCVHSRTGREISLHLEA